MSSKILKQMLRDQEKMSKQLEASGQAIAELRMNQRNTTESPKQPFGETKRNNPFFDKRAAHTSGGSLNEDAYVSNKSTMGEKHHHMRMLMCPTSQQ
jgi:hypothetical protein